MAIEVAALKAVLSADTSDYDKGLTKADSSFKKFGTAIKRGALIAGAAIGGGLAIAAKIGFDEFREGEKVAAQTSAVLKSTGGVANVTAKQVDALAESILRKTGIDDEQIKTGENLLLTFKSIRNQVGRNNDIFTQATKVTADLSVAFGKDMKSSAIAVGKALNDPIKGVTALSRVGVQFTAQQREQIKTLVETGKTMDAQKLILKELNSEVGGSAVAAGKTFDGQMNILKETFKNTAGEIVGRFLPPLVSFAQTVAPLVTKALDGIAKLIDQFVAPAMSRVGKVASEEWPRIRTAAEQVFFWLRDNIFPIISKLRDIFVAMVHEISKVLEDNGPELRRIFDRLGEAITAIAKVAVPILRVAFVEVLPVILKSIIVTLDLVTGAAEGIVKTFRTIGNIAGDIFRGVAKVIEKSGALEVIHQVVRGIGTIIAFLYRVIGLARSAADAISKIPNPIDKVKGPSGIDIIKGVFGRAAGGPVRANQSYLVGERGPELFTPGASGAITPNGALGGGGTVINVYAPLGGPTETARWLRDVIRTGARDGIVIDQPQPGF